MAKAKYIVKGYTLYPHRKKKNRFKQWGSIIATKEQFDSYRKEGIGTYSAFYKLKNKKYIRVK